METTPVEVRRCCERYPLRYPAVFSWCDEEGERHVAEGMTRDLAVNGAYVYAAICPPVRSHILLEVRATNAKTTATQFCLNAKGEVCRAEAFGAGGGFAMRIAHGFRVSRIPGDDVATSIRQKSA